MFVLRRQLVRVRLVHLSDHSREVEQWRMDRRVYEPGLVELAHVDVRVSEREVIYGWWRCKVDEREVAVADEVHEHECTEDYREPG